MSKSSEGKISARRLLLYIILVVTSQLSDTQVDNAAHIGGVVSGIIIGVIYMMIGIINKKRDNIL